MDDAQELTSALERIDQRLSELLEELGLSLSLTANMRRVAWEAAVPTDVQFHGERAGIAVFNETAADLFVGFSPGSGAATLCRFTVAAKHYLVLPIETAIVSLGAAAAASATLIELERPLPFSGGAY